ncbi:MAG: sulfite exporter TauE/SafE family protein [Blastomonas sp.]|nr:sulfite exporter TauE/SafE family protein [Blastomonas sp.]
MTDLPTLLTCLLFLAIALLYACAGQAGASGYIAVMALLGYAPESIKPTALILNTLVSLVVSWRFVKDKHFDWPLFWPFALGALPLALLGGYLTLPQQWFEYLLGVLLLTAGGLSFLRKPAAETQPRQDQRLRTRATLRQPAIDQQLIDARLARFFRRWGWILLGHGLRVYRGTRRFASAR